jgi:ribonuclease T2
LKKIGIYLCIFSAFGFARYDATPTQSCEAYNNMKHTRNTHHIVLDTSKEYTVIKHHKGQNLILVKGESPAQRWVDDDCFSKPIKKTNRDDVSPVKSQVVNIEDELTFATINIARTKHTKKYQNNISSKQNLLALSWHNAFCETHRSKKECKRGFFSGLKKKYSESHFVLHGLWPQPKSKQYCNVDKELVAADKHKQWRNLPCLALDEETEERLDMVMPGFASDLHKHEWIKHGTCYGTEADRYFRDAISLTEQFNDSKMGDFFAKHIGKQVTLKQVRHLFDRNFGIGAGKRVELKCKKGLVTELWLHLGSGSNDLKELLAKGKKTRSRCHKGIIDRAGF